MKFDDLKLTGTEVTVRRTPAEASVLKNLGGIYDEFSKLVFIFDDSASMNTRIARSYTEQWNWPAEKLEAIRTDMAAAVAKANARPAVDMETLLDDEEEDGEELEEEAEPLAPFTDREEVLLKLATQTMDGWKVPEMTDEQLEEAIVRADLTGELGIEVNWEKHKQEPPTRIQLVKKLARRELENRLKKYPNSQIAMIAFGGSATVFFDEGTAEELWAAIDRLRGWAGETNILSGIKKGVDICRAHPSTVGVHHFVIVSDGRDSVTDGTIGEWVPNLKASGVVMDYIHIGDTDVNQGLCDACKALNGTCITVNSELQFEKHFIEAVSRCLPAPAL